MAKSRVTFLSDLNARQHRHSRCQPFKSRQAAAGACVAAELIADILQIYAVANEFRRWRDECNYWLQR